MGIRLTQDDAPLYEGDPVAVVFVAINADNSTRIVASGAPETDVTNSLLLTMATVVLELQSLESPAEPAIRQLQVFIDQVAAARRAAAPGDGGAGQHNITPENQSSFPQKGG